MSARDSFAELMAQLRAGDNDAFTAVFQRFQRRLIALARRQLRDRLAGKEDPEDVLQSVFRSFFTRLRAEQFDLHNWESLWGLLTLITLRKCGQHLRHYRAGCRNVQREVPLASADAAPDSWNLLAREPAPEEVAVVTETVERLMRWLEPRDRAILTLHLQEFTIPEISARVGWAERTVRRAVERVRKRLQEVWDAEEQQT